MLIFDGQVSQEPVDGFDDQLSELEDTILGLRPQEAVKRPQYFL